MLRMIIARIVPILLGLCLANQVLSQNAGDTIQNLNDKLSRGNITVSAILSDPSLMTLHSSTPFRDVIKQNAKAEKITIVTASEPGTRITVKGNVLDKSGKPEANKLVYVYQTSSQGWYSDTAPHILKNEGDRKYARLFGYFKTDQAGRFEFSTVKPQGYPHSDLPAHIHIEIDLGNGRSLISELLFDDDPRLIGGIRTRSIQEKFLIEKNTGTQQAPVYSYSIQVPIE